MGVQAYTKCRVCVQARVRLSVRTPEGEGVGSKDMVIGKGEGRNK